MWAYLFRIDICKNKLLNSDNSSPYAKVARMSDSESLLGRTGWETDDSGATLSSPIFGHVSLYACVPINVRVPIGRAE